jgi:hypothetical protein
VDKVVLFFQFTASLLICLLSMSLVLIAMARIDDARERWSNRDR